MVVSPKLDLNLVMNNPTALNALSDSTEVAGIEHKAKYSFSNVADLFLLTSKAENSCFKALLISIAEFAWPKSSPSKMALNCCSKVWVSGMLSMFLSSTGK